MPTPQLKALAKESDKSLPDVEKLWDKAKAIAEDEGHKKDYPYIMGILRRMLGIKTEQKESYSKYTRLFNDAG
jgi:hypothetical protein